MDTDKYFKGLILRCRFSKNFYRITKVERCKKSGYKKYWVKGMSEHSAECKNSKTTLRSLYLIANNAAQVLYGSFYVRNT